MSQQMQYLQVTSPTLVKPQPKANALDFLFEQVVQDNMDPQFQSETRSSRTTTRSVSPMKAHRSQSPCF
jgi:hypothetical protein